MVFIRSALWRIRVRGLQKLPDGRDWPWGKLGLVLMGRAMLSKPLIQFSIDGQGCVPSLFFDLRPNYGQGKEDNGDLLQKVPCMHCALSAPDPAAGRCPPTTSLETPGHSQESLGQSLVGSLLLSPGSWCWQGFVCALQESVSPVLCKFCNQIPLPSKVKFPGGSQSLYQTPRFGNLLEYYSSIKRNTFESVLMMLMNLESITQGEGSQKKKDNYHILMHICGI